MYTMLSQRLTEAEMKELLLGVERAQIGLIGDLCLDLYWMADMRLSELSRETPHYPLPIVEERFAPGGAGNAACNIASLRPGKLLAAGVVGMDWRGDLLLRALNENGMDTSLVIRSQKVTTNTYIKPLRRGVSDVVYEDPRLDFENRQPLDGDMEEKVLQSLAQMAQQVDVICVSDQMKYGCITPRVRKALCELGRNGKTVIVDSRDHAADYAYVTVKPNEVEASRAFGDGSVQELEALGEIAAGIAGRNERTTLMTLGAQGCFVADGKTVVRCPACRVEPPIDFCGAGDTFLAVYGTMLAAGASPLQAAQAATLGSSVTIRKIGTTGTATREELMEAWRLYWK